MIAEAYYGTRLVKCPDIKDVEKRKNFYYVTLWGDFEFTQIQLWKDASTLLAVWNEPGENVGWQRYAFVVEKPLNRKQYMDEKYKDPEYREKKKEYQRRYYRARKHDNTRSF